MPFGKKKLAKKEPEVVSPPPQLIDLEQKLLEAPKPPKRTGFHYPRFSNSYGFEGRRPYNKVRTHYGQQGLIKYDDNKGHYTK